MGSSGERNSIRIYKTTGIRQWRLSFQPGDVHSLFEELIHRRWGRARWQPDTDVIKTATGYVVEVDLPGVDEESVSVTVLGRYLTIEGRRSTGRTEGRAVILVCERPEGPFSRVIQFREDIEGFEIRKSMTGGVLTLLLTRIGGGR
jgi:HSP20 family molecular chaperone IbpA